MSMFCFQCQEAAKGTGCTIQGVCGKTTVVAKLQDVLLHSAKGLALVNKTLREAGESSKEAELAMFNSLFVTITNANFDDAAIAESTRANIKLRKEKGKI